MDPLFIHAYYANFKASHCPWFHLSKTYGIIGETVKLLVKRQVNSGRLIATRNSGIKKVFHVTNCYSGVDESSDLLLAQILPMLHRQLSLGY